MFLAHITNELLQGDSFILVLIYLSNDVAQLGAIKIL